MKAVGLRINSIVLAKLLEFKCLSLSIFTEISNIWLRNLLFNVLQDFSKQVKLTRELYYALVQVYVAMCTRVNFVFLNIELFLIVQASKITSHSFLHGNVQCIKIICSYSRILYIFEKWWQLSLWRIFYTYVYN